MDQAALNYSLFDTTGGVCGIVWRGARIARFQLPARSAAETERNVLRRAYGAQHSEPTLDVERVIADVKRYFAGDPIDFSDIEVELSGQEDLFIQIYSAARRVGWGRTTTYGSLARELGLGPEFARDVGQAMAKNPVPLIIPCHRVLAAGGKVGGFSAPGGSASKVRMLELEGVRVGPLQPAQQSLPL